MTVAAVVVMEFYLCVCASWLPSPTACKPFMDDNCAVNAITILLFGLAYIRVLCVYECTYHLFVGECAYVCGCLHQTEYLITISENAAHKHHYNRIIIG